MGLTPADVHNVAFKKPSIGKRGYDEDEVDAFLDLVETEMTRLIEANADGSGSAAPAAPAASAPTATSSPAASSSDEAGQPTHTQAARLLGLAQETADRLTSEARTESETLLTDARAKAEALVADAQEKADALAAKSAADADATVADSQARADALDTESKATYAAVTGQLEAEKATLQTTIADLRSYEREYRTRLKAWIGEQLEQLDEVGAAPVTNVRTSDSGADTDEAGSLVDQDGHSDSADAVVDADRGATGDTDEAGSLVDADGSSDSAAAVEAAAEPVTVTKTFGRRR
ncbi:DivIVA domain-containing protein [Nakamurella flavida]|uniref:Cell wall synthesis protein Wag31 n=1 Tax=Nakamurella flavida TaxID=363630 RepID=A0A938YK92_9ACTN|nr:DivIVA domain-containing protein [Nakamurella flavida]MBM9477517.1 DivIVA domain-containing protein [Nakamurella flavida]MDP9777450.1 DivIVA domain-containing protein [Nakamurella flavida]